MQTHTHDISFAETEVRKRFLRWADGEAAREWACLKLIWTHAPGIAPRPLRLEKAGDHPVVVMERLAGTPLGGAPLSAAQTEALGRTLLRLHGIPTEVIEEAGLAERRLGPSTLPEALRGWLCEQHDLSACHDPALITAGIAAGAEWLAQPDALPAPELSCLGIADLNPTNVLWDGRACRLVDFEDGGLTDPAYDLADHVEHIASRTHGVFDPETLGSAVGLSDGARERMRAYRPLWATFWLAMLLPGNGGFHRNPPGTTELQARHLLALVAG
ncbi:aminoglycoside phosphotransferase family protein [Labedella populi]|nr:aminoglycoside phosphotransferase family protein [Labedella populi]